MFDAVGRVVKNGNTVRWVVVEALSAVTLSSTAAAWVAGEPLAPAGIPPRPAAAKLYVCPAPTAGPDAFCPSTVWPPPRVSTMRAGYSGWNDVRSGSATAGAPLVVAGGGVAPGTRAPTSIGVSAR